MTTWSGSEHFAHGLIVREGLDIDSFSTTPRIVTAGGAIAVSRNDFIVLVMQTSPQAVNINLPAAPSMQRLTIKDAAGTASSFPLTILPASGTIDGSSSMVLNNAYASVDLIFNGTNWNIL